MVSSCQMPGHSVFLPTKLLMEPQIISHAFLKKDNTACKFCFNCRQATITIHTHTHTHPFNGPFSGTTHVSRYQKAKPIWILLKQKTVSGSGISWAICKSAPRSRQITTPAPHHSVFYRPDALPATQPKASKH